jgi:hypothetical protein
LSAPAVGLASRSISSQVLQPTSPTQTSLLPGLMVKRNGLRSPEATIRRALVSGPVRGLSGSGAPVAGSIRRIVPDRPVGSPPERRSWLRRAPPSAVGGVSVAPTPPGGSPHGFTGLPSWP